MPNLSTSNRGVSPGNYDLSVKLASFGEARAAFLEGTSTPRELLETCLARIDERDGEVQAFCHLDAAAAREAADASTKRYADNRPLSPIDGCPLGIKDTIDVRGMPSRMNSDLFGETVRFDAASSYALRAAGAVLLGKTHVPEFAFGRTPPTRNPFDLRRTAGGSSSGSGAAVGAGMVPATIGNQTGGSLIRPSSFSAAYGYKPTFGALNVAGMQPIAPSQDHIGPMAASLSDAWSIAWEISNRIGGHGGHGGLVGTAALPTARRPLRLARLETQGHADLDEGTREAMASALQMLREHGVDVIDRRNDGQVATLEDLLAEADAVSNDILMYEVRWPLVAYIDANGTDAVSATARSRLDRGLAMSPGDYRTALTKRDRMRAQVAAIGARVDGFVTLASSGPAPFDGREADGGVDQAGAHMKTGSRSFLSPWSMVGGPSLSLPLLAVDQMPVGVQLMGVPDSDYTLIAIARWIDTAVRV